MNVRLCADEVVVITIEPRTGRLTLRDTGDLAAAGRGPRFAAISEKLNESPTILAEALVRLRFSVSGPCVLRVLYFDQADGICWDTKTITDMAEQKANYLGLQSYRHRNFSREGKGALVSRFLSSSSLSLRSRTPKTWCRSTRHALHSAGELQ